jgi:light-regulated signal transduction histidine kinase (bacteriophytochrome)
MGGLIDDLLRLSQVTRAALAIRLVDLSAMAREISAGLDEERPERRIAWTIEDGMVIQADAALLRIALNNLMQNAAKFTGRAQKPAVRVGTLEREGRRVYFVADNGVGFDMAHATRLFGAFQRLHNVADFSGTGIGLAIVERILRRHHGRIWAEAKPGEGATFFFTLAEPGANIDG